MAGAKIELVSVHVPKTTGTSFKSILRKNWGSSLLELYGSRRQENVQALRNAGSWVRAIHGHIKFAPYLEMLPRAKSVTWLRDPVERLLSHYSYWKEIDKHGNPLHDEFLDTNASIEWLAERLRGITVQHFESVRLSDIDFVGVVEYFRDDLRDFCLWLRQNNLLKNSPALAWCYWRAVFRFNVAPRRNVTREKLTISEKRRSALKALLKEDYELYEKARELRGKRRAASLGE